ncbi:MAG TPA: prepilin-type N-terminal cleavage/methylation domain-containing protein [Gemmatirosa sp.]|nr:prepilin-type N-terminal cleavage/methylation domain-containing protein [Gemmatirosa sp.]
MPLTRRRPAGPRVSATTRERRGFTLVELIIGLTLAVGIAALLGSMLVFQSRAFARTQGATAVQRNLRMGIALLPMDLRAASREGRDLRQLEATQIALMANIGTSIVCGFTSPPPGQPLAPLTIAMAPTSASSTRPTLTTFFTAPVVGDTVKVLVRMGMGGLDDIWLTAVVEDVPLPATGASGLCAVGPFTEPPIPPATVPAPRNQLRLRWRGEVTAAQVARLAIGAPVRVLRPVQYHLYQPANSAEGRWYLGYAEYTANAWGAMEPIAGPFDAADSPNGAGIGFAYFDTLGAPLTAPIPPANANLVGRIDLTLRPRTTARGAARDSLVLRDSAVVRVSLRNRI